ncbi:MAG: LicD family protein, partial [Eggerthellaceae bacterium]|nr:LicD family protein [Eggerthellaceae bacterium]
VRATQPDGIEIVRLPCIALMGGRLPIPAHGTSFQALLDTVANMHPDRVVVNTRFYGLSLDGASFAAKMGLPLVVIEHGSAYLTLGNAFADKAIRTYEHQVTERILAFEPTFAGVSQAANTWLENFGIQAAGVVPNALDADSYRADASSRDFRAELRIGLNDTLVAVVGRMVPEKGIQAVIDAAQFTPENIVFALAGDGPLLETAQSAQGRICALGRLAPTDVAALLRDSDAYLLPSRSEGFSTTLLEACAMEAFPIATDIGGVAELGIGTRGGIVIPDASTVSIAAAVQATADLKDEAEAQAHTLGRFVVEHCTWNASACALDEIFAKSASACEDARMAADGASARGRHAKLTPGEATIVAAAAEASAAGDEGTFETDEKLQKLHSILLMMMKDFADLCARHDLAWIVSYGSAIGALRHKGFIPWDDDIDICMPRTDLERLGDIVAAEAADKYLIVDARTYAGYPLATTRFVLRGTEFRDSALAGMDFPSGIFLDLFPLDNLADDENAFKRQVYGAWLLNKLALAKQFENPTIARAGATGAAMRAAATFARRALNLPGLREIDPNQAAEQLSMKYAGIETRRVGFPCDTFPDGCLYDVDDLYPVRWVPFEDMEVPIAAQAEKLLDEYYGDWMTPPPGNARRAHYPDILDFGPYA